VSFGRYVDPANMSEEPAASVPAVKTKRADSPETSVSVLSPKFKLIVWFIFCFFSKGNES
jgi:hypothetical protein